MLTKIGYGTVPVNNRTTTTMQRHKSMLIKICTLCQSAELVKVSFNKQKYAEKVNIAHLELAGLAGPAMDQRFSPLLMSLLIMNNKTIIICDINEVVFLKTIHSSYQVNVLGK